MSQYVGNLKLARKIEFWLIQPKQPFEISTSRNYVKKPQALSISTNTEKSETSQKKKKFNNIFIHAIVLKKNITSLQKLQLTSFSSYS